jgi:hypothetical protein
MILSKDNKKAASIKIQEYSGAILLGHGHQFPCFLVGVHPRTCQKPDTHGDFQGKACAPARGHIDGQLRMLPVLKLIPAHIEFTTCDFTQQYITVSGFELTFFKAHRLGTVAAPATLMKHELPETLFELVHYFFRLRRNQYPLYHGPSEENQMEN